MKALSMFVLRAVLLASMSPALWARGVEGSQDEAKILACLQSAADAFHIDVLPLVVLQQERGPGTGSEQLFPRGTSAFSDTSSWYLAIRIGSRSGDASGTGSEHLTPRRFGVYECAAREKVF